MVLAKEKYGIRERELVGATLVAFTAQTRMSGVDFADRRVARAWPTRYGAGWKTRAACSRSSSGTPSTRSRRRAARPSSSPKGRAEGSPHPPRPLGVIYLKDIVKPGIAERFADLRRMGIRTVMITGDNPRTAAVSRRRLASTTSSPRRRRKTR